MHQQRPNRGLPDSAIACSPQHLQPGVLLDGIEILGEQHGCSQSPRGKAGREYLGAVGQFAVSKWLVLAEILGVVEGDKCALYSSHCVLSPLTIPCLRDYRLIFAFETADHRFSQPSGRPVGRSSGMLVCCLRLQRRDCNNSLWVGGVRAIELLPSIVYLNAPKRGLGPG